MQNLLDSFDDVIVFHIYKEVWTPFIGERIGCARERSNREDPFAVAMKRVTETVGHVPRTISCVCTLFLGSVGPYPTGPYAGFEKGGLHCEKIPIDFLAF